MEKYYRDSFISAGLMNTSESSWTMEIFNQKNYFIFAKVGIG
jgi:hypothetical protein